MFKQYLEEKSKEIGIELSKEQIEQFSIYKEMLLEWNEKINLTTIIDDKEITLKHFIDSLSILKYINRNSSIIDIGTGAGFPGIPLEIIDNTFSITLLDSLNKRIAFLDTVITKLHLSKVKTIHGRAEEIAQKEEYREQYDVATARAVARLNVLIEYCLPYVKIGGRFICMKGQNLNEEILEAKGAIEILGGEIEQIKELELPEIKDKRTVIIIKKVKNTPEKYPRKAGIPTKQPIL